MTVTRAMLTLVVLAASAVPGRAVVQEPTLRDKQQAACYEDAMRLCGAFVPDEEKVTACMLTKQKQVSPGCRVFFPKYKLNQYLRKIPSLVLVPNGWQLRLKHSAALSSHGVHLLSKPPSRWRLNCWNMQNLQVQTRCHLGGLSINGSLP